MKIDDAVLYPILADALLKAKIEKLTIDILDHTITAEEARKVLDKFEREVVLAMSREQTAQDINICLN